jgi:polysaccharide biosynthesis transport protein
MLERMLTFQDLLKGSKTKPFVVMTMFTDQTSNSIAKLLKICRQWWWVWIGTTVLFGAIGLCYVTFFKNDVWVASQGLIVRDEANGAVMRLGRFQSQTEMKAAQETIVELARNPHVLTNALAAIGPDPSTGRTTNWPDAKDVESTIKSVAVRAPRGAEMGTTEVIYLDTKHGSRQRAYQLNLAICDALEARLQEVRRARADGVLAELTTARDTAVRDLASATDRLQEMERQAGADLGDLRGMTDAGSGTNSSRIQLDAIKNERHQADLRLQQMVLDLDLVDQALTSTEQLLGPNTIVNSQPGLKKLREGLADARIQAAQLQGRFTLDHPQVIASVKAERGLEVRLRQEYELARVSLANDVGLAQRRIEDLKQQQSQLEIRLANLASMRAEYGNVLAEVRARSQIVQDAQRELSEVQAARDAANSCSLVTRIDEPLASETPVGPGRSTIFAGTTIVGLIFGLGAIFLLTPFEGAMGYGRRHSDFEPVAGRRQSDRAGAMRATDSGRTNSVCGPSTSMVAVTFSPENSISLVEVATTAPVVKSRDTIEHTVELSSTSSDAEQMRRPLPTRPRAI